MTQKQWKMISTIISIIILIVFALYKAFGEQNATKKSKFFPVKEELDVF